MPQVRIIQLLVITKLGIFLSGEKLFYGGWDVIQFNVQVFQRRHCARKCRTCKYKKITNCALVFILYHWIIFSQSCEIREKVNYVSGIKIIFSLKAQTNLSAQREHNFNKKKHMMKQIILPTTNDRIFTYFHHNCWNEWSKMISRMPWIAPESLKLYLEIAKQSGKWHI